MDKPRPDILLTGENGVGKTTFARAYHLLRPASEGQRLGFLSLDLGALDLSGSSASLALCGATPWAGGGEITWSFGCLLSGHLLPRWIAVSNTGPWEI